MNKKVLLVAILVLTIITIGIILIFRSNTRYNNLVISDEKWNDIINSRIESTSISFETIKFNDYNSLIDEENSIIYYSVVDSSKKYNPSIEYTTNVNKLKIAVNNQITSINDDNLKIILYDDNNYHIYSLTVTNYPILNISTKEQLNDKKRIDIELELFDNHDTVPQRVVKSIGKLKVIDENRKYSFSLIKESLGHNKRENHISILGMEKHDEYTLEIADSIKENQRYVQFFINNKYIGIYSLSYKEGSMNNFERNKQKNK